MNFETDRLKDYWRVNVIITKKFKVNNKKKINRNKRL